MTNPKTKLFLVKNGNSAEYEILRGIHPFNSERIYHSKIFHAIGPASETGYSVIVEDNIPLYVFEAEQGLDTHQAQITSARTKLGALAKKQGLEYIDTTFNSTPALLSSRASIEDCVSIKKPIPKPQ